ncbi:MAG: sulfite oxidase [Actinomycetota bacterium]
MSERSQISLEELQLAARNHGMALEALRYDLTPVGLHYLLIHYDIPAVDPSTWRLQFGGTVAQPSSFSLEDLSALPRASIPVTMECAGNGRALLEPRPVSQPWLLEAVGTAEWAGTPLVALLDRVGVDPDTVELVFTGLDRGVEGGEEQTYARSLPLAECRREEVLLADEINGAPLPPQHGAPLRLLVPGWYGMTSVKWLGRIDAVSEQFRGYQNERGYRFRRDDDDPGEPVTRIVPRALIEPPGIPEFMTRARLLPPGRTVLRGRAWSGRAPIERVEVSVDDGHEWRPATVGAAPSPWAWHSWRFAWDAPEGDHLLQVRATDALGTKQPDQPGWNVGGYSNNAPHRVPVTVRAGVLVGA